MESFIGNPEVRQVDCLRLAVLFALKYESQFKGGELDSLNRMLQRRGISEQRRKVGGLANYLKELLAAIFDFRTSKYVIGKCYAIFVLLNTTCMCYSGCHGELLQCFNLYSSLMEKKLNRKYE